MPDILGFRLSLIFPSKQRWTLNSIMRELRWYKEKWCGWGHDRTLCYVNSYSFIARVESLVRWLDVITVGPADLRSWWLLMTLRTTKQCRVLVSWRELYSSPHHHRAALSLLCRRWRQNQAELVPNVALWLAPGPELGRYAGINGKTVKHLHLHRPIVFYRPILFYQNCCPEMIASYYTANTAIRFIRADLLVHSMWLMACLCSIWLLWI